MAEIRLLDSSTVDKIAAGEVVERPSSVVKELVENALDAEADAVTVEIRDGGCSFLRVTDNGGGIEREQVRKAFFRHATSKIGSAEDLFHIRSLGFRGEALSSIAAVSMVELITKPEGQITGIRYCLEGERETGFSEVGAPDGTTFIVRELFFNTPVRKKFLKSPATEGGYISDLMEHMALSRPDVAFQFMVNGNVRFHTSGNGDVREIIYRIYGKETVQELIPFQVSKEGLEIEGFLGSPSIVRSNRNFEFLFVNGRYIRSPLLSKGLEAGYKAYLMQHRFPFALLHIHVDPEEIDVNVHPSKMEIRFHDQPGIYALLEEQIRAALRGRELIPNVTLDIPGKKKGKQSPAGQPLRPEAVLQTGKEQRSARPSQTGRDPLPIQTQGQRPASPDVAADGAGEMPDGMPSRETAQSGTLPRSQGGALENEASSREIPREGTSPHEASVPQGIRPEAPQPFETHRRNRLLKEEEGTYAIADARQMDLFDGKLLTREAARDYHILGQVFGTYWLVEYEDKLLILDQHAAHEKVKYEALVHKIRTKTVDSQILTPPMVMNLSARERHILMKYAPFFGKMGFEIEDFGGNAVAVRAVPCELFGHCEKDFLQEILDGLEEEPPHRTPSVIEEKLASMACRSAVKGNHRMSVPELTALLGQLMELEDPYHCPHGRPTIITMSRYELEKRFKRII